MNLISHTPALGFVNRSWVFQSCSASPMVTKIGLIVVKDPNGVLTVDVFVNNQQYKIDISVNHLICLSLSSKVKERKFLMYRALIAYIRKVYTTDNLSQIETQSWKTCQMCQNCHCCVIFENLKWRVCCCSCYCTPTKFQEGSVFSHVCLFTGVGGPYVTTTWT